MLALVALFPLCILDFFFYFKFSIKRRYTHTDLDERVCEQYVLYRYTRSYRMHISIVSEVSFSRCRALLCLTKRRKQIYTVECINYKIYLSAHRNELAATSQPELFGQDREQIGDLKKIRINSTAAIHGLSCRWVGYPIRSDVPIFNHGECRSRLHFKI